MRGVLHLREWPVTFTVTAGGGTLSITSTVTDADGRAESALTLGLDQGTNTVSVSVPGIQGKRTFVAEGIRILNTDEVDIPDPNLRAAIATALGNPEKHPCPDPA